ncbi:cupin-like domain-containing protein [Microbulbifer sp. Q7]|uniref:cupin-like domain-containing protein n=1 Tax=Microbulbifer sp. Q7 TaxID=1785091 RepID=UPI000B33BE84|nr:cupin-like domain-containing protein [Microbulbifer sp. Q7]
MDAALLERMKNIPSIRMGCGREFQDEIVARHTPVVFRGGVKDWELVRAARQSDEHLIKYLNKRVIPGPVKIIEGSKESGGYFFYDDVMSGFNFRRVQTTFFDFSDRLLRAKKQADAPVLSLQSAYIDEYFSGVHDENSLDLFGADVRPRIWIGGKSIVATHYDDAENLACCVAGRRRFVLFPPQQVGNLYIGPIDNTPAGAPVSMVSLMEPDFERFPRFEQALGHAWVAELEPGDVIYIPALWWHHVESLEAVNALVNYWQGGSIGGELGPSAVDAMLLGMLALKHRSAPVKDAWRALFDHYVFGQNGDAGEHIPAAKRGFLGDLDEERVKNVKAWLIKQLSDPGRF